MSDRIVKTVVLPIAPDRAFALFTEQAGEWWPASRRHTSDAESAIRIESSGRFYERAADGREVELGSVTEWQPPHRLELDFFVGTSSAEPTAVTITFVAEGDGTRVTVDHRPTPASRGAWERRAPRFDASWTLVLEALRGFVDR